MTAWRACLGKIGRKTTINSYRVKVMRSDGTTVFGRCEEPRQLIQLPLDLRHADEVERRIRLADRKPKVRRVVEDNIYEEQDSFDFQNYTNRR